MSSDGESSNCFAYTSERKRIAQPLRGQHSPDSVHDTHELIGLLPAAIYTTDADGRITYYNEAAAELWGCRPDLGKSEFCGSWKLYWSDGTPLPHDECPMALALKQRRPIRGMEAVAERPDGTRVPFVPYPTPMFDASGNLTGAVNMLVDITERKASEQKVRTQARRFELLNQVAKVITNDLDLDRIAQSVIDVATELSGAEFGAFFHSVADAQGESHLLHASSGASHETFEGLATPGSTLLLEATFRGAGVIRCDDVHIDPRYGKNPLHFLPQGGLPVVSYLAVPLVRWGQVRGGLFLGHSRARVFSEETEQVIDGIAAHAAIAIDNARHHQAAARLSAIVEDTDDAIISKNLDGVILSWNKGAERLFGYAAHEAIGTPIATVIPADRQDEEPRILERIKRGERIDHYETVRQRKDGSLVDVSLTVSPMKDAAGRIVGASKIARDISARKKAQERQELLAREIQHRTKNLFAVVHAVVGRSFAGKETVADAEGAVLDRLSSLAQTHVMLLDKRWGGINIAEIVGAEMSPYAGRVRIDGPKLMLHPKAAQNFSLALHELATNAAKYGALSNATGSVHITWRVSGLNGQGTFSLCWQEHGGPPVAVPERKGFGSTVLEYVMGEYFSEPPRMEFAPSGLRYALTAPVEALVSADQPRSEGGGDGPSSRDTRGPISTHHRG
jgi:PAS domain S-box-containing protein